MDIQDHNMFNNIDKGGMWHDGNELWLPLEKYEKLDRDAKLAFSRGFNSLTLFEVFNVHISRYSPNTLPTYITWQPLIEMVSIILHRDALDRPVGRVIGIYTSARDFWSLC
jgi:hypothetical protein